MFLIFGLVASLTHAQSTEKQVITKEQRVLVVGDSISAAFGLDKRDGWVNLLDQALGPAVTFVNVSISGDTTSGGRYRIDRALSEHKPDIVVIELGGNDALRGTPIKAIATNLEVMITKSVESGAKVILAGMQIPPNYGERYTNSFKELYPQVAEKTGATLIPFLMAGVAGVEGMMQEDGIHPTKLAQPIMMEHVKRALKPKLKLVADD